LVLVVATLVLVILSGWLFFRNRAFRQDQDKGSAPPAAVAADATAAGPGRADAAIAVRVLDAGAPEVKVPPALSEEQIKTELEQAQALLKQKQRAEAIAALESLLARVPDHAATRTALGEAFRDEGHQLLEDEKFPAAVVVWQKVVKLLPEDAESWFRLGFSHFFASQMAEAQAALEKYLLLCPRCQWASFAREHLAKAKAALEKPK
jgi:tetratricopeptide (TPR) repeat protein